MAALFTRITSSTSAVALLVLFISLSAPVSASAFSSSSSSTFHHNPSLSSRVPTIARNNGGSGLYQRTSSARIMKESPRSVLCLSELAAIRGGGEQIDDGDGMEESFETASDYGTTENNDVEMASKSTTLKSKTSDLTSEDDATSTVASSKRLALSAVTSPITSIMATFATFYTHQLSVRPILTKSLTAGIIFMASDYSAQLIESEGDSEEEKSPLVWSRMWTNFLVGLLVFGPAANAWYSMIFQLLPSTSLFSTLKKAALGQIIFGPAFTCVFFGAGMIQSKSFSWGGWIQKIRQDLPAVWASGLGFWPFVDFISYKVIPVQWIPLFVNFCSFVWTIYLSMVSNRGRGEEA